MPQEFDFSDIVQDTTQVEPQSQTSQEFDFSDIVSDQPIQAPTEEQEEFSFTDDIGASASNALTQIKGMPSRLGLLNKNIAAKLQHGTADLADYLVESVGLPEDYFGGELARQAGNNILNKATDDILKLDEYHKQLKPSQGLVEAFGSGDPEKIAAAGVGAVINAGSSIAQGIATGGVAPIMDQVALAYTNALYESGKGDVEKQVSLFMNDEDKEAIPMMQGVMSAALEKIGLDKLTGNILSNVPVGAWKAVMDVAKTAGVEGTTEALQSVVEQVGSDLTQGREVSIDPMEVLESGLQGAIGSAGVTGGASTIKGILKNTKTGSVESDMKVNETVDSALEVLEDPIVKETLSLTKEVDTKSEADPIEDKLIAERLVKEPVTLSEAVDSIYDEYDFIDPQTGETVTGTLSRDEGGKVQIEYNGKVQELGNLDDLRDSDINELGISFKEGVIPNEDGSFIVNGQNLRFLGDDVEKSSKQSKKGTVLTMIDDKNRKIRIKGNEADEILRYQKESEQERADSDFKDKYVGESFDVGDQVEFRDSPKEGAFIDSEGREVDEIAPEMSVSKDEESFDVGESVEFSVNDKDSKPKVKSEDSKLDTTEEVDHEEVTKEPIKLTRVDNKQIEQLEDIAVDKNVPAEDQKAAREIQEQIKREGLTKESKKKIDKLYAKAFSEGLKGTNAKLAKGLKIGLQKYASMAMNIKAISKLDEGASKLIDKFTKHKLEKDKITTDRVQDDVTKELQSLIVDNNLSESDLLAVGIDGMLKSTDETNTLEKNIQKVRKVTQNKVNHYNSLRGRLSFNYQKAVAEQKIAEDIIGKLERGENTLTDGQQSLKDFSQSKIESLSDDYKKTSSIYWGNEFNEVNNYFPTNAVGGFKTKDQSLSEMQKDVYNQMDDNSGTKNKPTPKVNRGYHTIDRADADNLGDVFYDFDTSKLLLDYMKNATFEIEAAPTLYAVTTALKDESVKKQLGTGAKILMDNVKGYVNRERGVKKSSVIKAADKLRSNVISATMATAGQLPKQLIPAVAQSLTTANGNLVTASRALKNVAMLNGDWYKENAPGLYERGKSLERITHGEQSASVKGVSKGTLDSVTRKIADRGEQISSFPIQWGDILAARQVFMTAFLRMGGDINNVDPEIARAAELEQQTMQNVNTAALSGYAFNSDGEVNQLLARTLLTYTNFALNQVFTAVNGAKNLDKAEGRRMLTGAITSAVTFAMTASIVRSITKEVTKKLGLGDDEDEDEQFLEEGFVKKAIANGAVDLTVGPIPFIGDATKAAIDKINKDYEILTEEDEYNKDSDKMFYTFQNPGMLGALEELAGPALGEAIGLMGDLVGNTYDAALEGDKRHLEMAFYSLAQFMNTTMSATNKYVPIPTGDMNKILKEAKKGVKREIEESKKSRGQARKRKKRTTRKR